MQPDLIAVYFFYAVPSAEKKKRLSQRDRDVIQISGSDVHIVEIENQYGAFSLVRTLSAWRIESPVGTEADRMVIEEIACYFEELKIKTGISTQIDDEQLSKYGLRTPRFSLVFRNNNGSTLLALKLGDTTPDGMGVYAFRSDREDVIILPMYITILLDKNLYGLRNRLVFNASAESILKVEVGFAGQRIVLEKTADKEWRIEEPLSDVPADNEAVQNILELLTGIEVIDFFNVSRTGLSQYGLDNPWAKIGLTRDGSNVPEFISLGFLNEAGGVFAKKNNVDEVVLLPIEVTRSMIQDIDTIRDKSVFTFRNSEISGITLTFRGKDQDISIRKTEGDFSIVTNQGHKKADTSLVEDYLNEIRELRVTKFLGFAGEESQSFGLENPLMLIALEKAGERPVTLEIGDNFPYDVSFVYARQSDFDELLLMDKKAVERLQKPRGYFDDRHVFMFDIGRVYDIEILFEDVETRLVRDRRERWRAIAPQKKPVNRFPVLLLLRELWRMKFIERLDTIEPEDLGTPDIKVEIFSEAESVPVSYNLWCDGIKGNGEMMKVFNKYYIVEEIDVELLQMRLKQIITQLQ